MPLERWLSGELRQRVTFYSPNKVQDEGGQPIETPVAVYENVPASVLNIGGDEESRGPHQLVAGATHLIKTRYLPELETQPDMFLLLPRDDPARPDTYRRLNVLRTVDVDFERRTLLHYCKEEPLVADAAS